MPVHLQLLGRGGRDKHRMLDRRSYLLRPSELHIFSQPPHPAAVMMQPVYEKWYDMPVLRQH